MKKDGKGSLKRLEDRMISNYLREQLNNHPSMEPGDVMKLCFQAAYGAEHLLMDKDAAYNYLLAEYKTIGVSEYMEPVFEIISEALCRVNLRSWKALGLPLKWLFVMFARGAEEAAEANRVAGEAVKAFERNVIAAESLIREDVFPFDLDKWQQYLSDYPLDNPVAVHHSNKYRIAEKPAYCLVPRKYIRILPVLEKVYHANLKMNMVEYGSTGDKISPYIIAIDGRCASGKSTMAGMLSEILDAGVVHMDDFFLPMELRTEKRLKEPGGNVHYERIQEEVIPNLKQEAAFSYRKFDCSQMKVSGEQYVPTGKIKIVEGAYSCHSKLGDYMHLRVFSDVDSKEQLARVRVREGEAALKSYRERWIPMEEQYLETYHIKDKADLIV